MRCAAGPGHQPPDDLHEKLTSEAYGVHLASRPLYRTVRNLGRLGSMARALRPPGSVPFRRRARCQTFAMSGWHLARSRSENELALRLKARGLSLREIGPQAGCSQQGVALVVRYASRRPVREHGWAPGPGWLTLADREEITLGLHGGESFTVIAGLLGKATSTVSREVSANGGRGPTVRGGRISAPASRPGGARPASCPALSWQPRSPDGWPNGGRPCRSRPGCGSSSQAIP
jgi:hypothetical protein